MMTWQEYRFYRFRQTRVRMYGDDIRTKELPINATPITVILEENGADRSCLTGLISDLLTRLHHPVEIIIRSKIGESLMGTEGFANHDQRIKVESSDDVRKLIRKSSEIGQYIAYISPNSDMQINQIDDMLVELNNNAKVDILWAGSVASDESAGEIIVTRSSIYWLLGEVPWRQDRPNWLAYWFQAGLILRTRCYLSDFGSPSNKSDFLVQLENSCTENERIMLDYLRDLYLAPWVCLLNMDGGDEDSCADLSRFLNEIERSGNIVIKSKDLASEIIKEQWVPKLIITPEKFKIGDKYREMRAIDHNPGYILQFPAVGDTELGQENCYYLKLRCGETRRFILEGDFGVIDDLAEITLLYFLDIWIHNRWAKSFRMLISPIRYISYPLKISVVISTYKRSNALREALGSIIQQNFSPQDYEIIVVNNDPTDNSVRQVIEDIRKGQDGNNLPQLRLHACPLPGISFVRNQGALESHGELLCFLDDDALASRDWLCSIWQAYLQHPDVGVIGGHIQLIPPKPKPRLIRAGWERFWSQYITNYVAYTEVRAWQEFPWGANWCAQRSVFLGVGGFRGQYGRTGKGTGGGEELICASLVQKLGRAIAIVPQALVFHRPDHSRYTFHVLRRTIIDQIVSSYRMRRDGYLSQTSAISSDLKGIRRFIQKVVQIAKLPLEKQITLLIEYSIYVNAWIYLLYLKFVDLLVRMLHRV